MARIRSVKPEFCTSEQVMSVTREARLTFILLWPFCDDGGVHPASLRVIKAELFPADDDVTMARLGAWLDELLKVGLIERFVANGQQYISVTGWKNYQRIEKPQPLRYPQPNSVGSVPVVELFGGGSLSQKAGTTMGKLPNRSRTATEPLPLGRKEGEDRKEKKEKTEVDDDFERWYATYPRHVGRAQAAQAYRTALAKTDGATLLAAVATFAAATAGTDPKFIPHPATWLNAQRWLDETPAGQPAPKPRPQAADWDYPDHA